VESQHVTAIYSLVLAGINQMCVENGVWRRSITNNVMNVDRDETVAYRSADRLY
jgi:hypothetical protein